MELVVNDSKPTICLNMIVKDESHIIKTTLEMLCSKINFSYWVICDTGSSDNTREIITDFFKQKNIPGELHNHVWKNFAHNRTLAFNEAYTKSDLLFIFDADDEIHGEINMPTSVDFDGYHLNFGSDAGISYQRVLLVNNRIKWEYRSVIHEFIHCFKPNATYTTIEGKYYVVSGRSGSRNKDPNKYLKDAKILEEAYNEAKPVNDILYLRYGFYCANSYKDAGKTEEAIKWYKIVLSNDNWVQEKYMACLNLYYCYKAIGQEESGIFYLVESIKYDTERFECLSNLINHYCTTGLNELCYSYYNIARDFYENKFLNYDTNGKLFIDNEKGSFLLPYYMILVSDKVKSKIPEAEITLYKMYEIIFTKKYPMYSEFFVGNLLYNLKFFIEPCLKNIPNFIELFQSYIEFLEKINYPIFKHKDVLMEFYNNYKIKVKIIEESINKFTIEECKKSKNILFYTGFSSLRWNYTYSQKNALGGSETAVANLAKYFPSNYNIYISGDVAEEKVDNVTYIHLHNLRDIVSKIPFHTLIVSRYVGFYEMFPETSFYKSFIWGHDIALYPYGCNLDIHAILNKWSAKINACICQTEWHKQLFYDQYPDLRNKLEVINNGILTENFVVKPVKRTNRFIYTSCSERGLDRLLEIWPRIVSEIPDAELFICSYNPFPKNDYDNGLKNIIDNNKSITHLGCLDRDKLYELMASAEFWLYPTWFPETSCITSMEMLMSEVICIYYPVAGLVNTLGDYGIPVERENEVNTILNLSTKQKTEMKKRGKEYILKCSWKNKAVEWGKYIFDKNDEINELNENKLDNNNNPKNSDKDNHNNGNNNGNNNSNNNGNNNGNDTSNKSNFTNSLLNQTLNYEIKIVNLKNRVDRREKLIQKLDKENIKNYSFFEAVNGRDLEFSDKLYKLFERNDFSFKKGVIGCALSHLFLWKQLINDEKNDFYVILEDDIDLCPNFKLYLNKACNLFVNQNIEHLALGEYHSQKDFPNEHSNIVSYPKDLYKEWNVTFGYIMSKNAAKKAIDYINTCSIKGAFDNPQAFGYILKYHALNYRLVKCEIINEHGSDIRSHEFFNVTQIESNKNLTIAFCDWWNGEYCGGIFDVNDNFFTNLLRTYSNNYNIQVIPPDQNPDILFYSIFGSSHSSFKAKRKIFFSGEPYPQRSDADFNLTFDSNSFSNTRVPLWLCYINDQNIKDFINRLHISGINNKKFCSFIASGPGLANNRQDFVNKLSSYKLVDCGGNYLNNIGSSVPIGMNCSGKIEHNKNYKFAMAFESKDYPGYVTEKICDIFKSNIVPIYWGTNEVVKDFNPKTFINANDFNSFDELVEFIKKVDNDDNLYSEYFKHAIFSPQWIDIFCDSNRVFFKNLADKIIGTNSSLFDDYYDSINNKWVVYSDNHTLKLITEWINTLDVDKNILITSNVESVKAFNPNKILCVNGIYNELLFMKSPNCSIDILNIDSYFFTPYLHALFTTINKYPNVTIYSYSKTNLDILKNYGINNTQLLKSYNEKEIDSLKEINKQPKIYDFGIIGYHTNLSENWRRKYIVDILINKGFSVKVITGFNNERDIELGKCKIILNIHSYLYKSATLVFQHVRCDRLLHAGFNILSEISCLDESYFKNFPNLKFIHFNDFDKITKENIDNFEFKNIEYDFEKFKLFNHDIINNINDNFPDYHIKKNVRVFNVWHNKLFDKCYENLDEYSLKKIVMYDVNPSYEKIYNKDKNYKIIKEYELKKYNNILQNTNYCQTSCLYHVYLNGFDSAYTYEDFALSTHEYVGFIQYDMELDKQFIYDIENKIDNAKNFIFFYSLVASDKIERHLLCKPYNNSILEKYNNYFKTNHTYDSITNHSKSKYFICLHTFVIPTFTYIKMMEWYCSIFDEVHSNYINKLYTESMSEVTEEIFGLFLLLQLIENDSIQLDELKLTHNWPNLHNQTSFNNYKNQYEYYPLSSLINNGFTDKNTYHTYIDVYEDLFKSRQLSTKNILEIGIERGGSIKLWNDYFIDANIYALDIIDPPVFLSNYKRIHTKKCDAYTSESVSYFTDKNILFDIIIDDGPHTFNSMVYVIENYLNLLTNNGILIIEDVQHIEWCDEFQKIVDKLNKNNKCFSSYGIDRRSVRGTLDDILFVIKKNAVDTKNNNHENISMQINEITEKDDDNKDLWIMYAFPGHNYSVIEDYINSLKQQYNIVYTQDMNYVINSNAKKISYIMCIRDETILNKFKGSQTELSILNTEPLSIEYNLGLLKHYIKVYPFLKIYDYSTSNLQLISNNNMYGELLSYKFVPRENNILKILNEYTDKIYDFGIITYGDTKVNTIDYLIHKRKDVVSYLISKGFSVHIISGWGIERDNELAKCKIILNIHSILGLGGIKYYSKTFENIRCNRLLDAGFKILSEDSIHCNDLIKKYDNIKFMNYNDFFNIQYSNDLWNNIDKNKIKKFCFIHSCDSDWTGRNRLDHLLFTLSKINIFDKIYINHIGSHIEPSANDKIENINTQYGKNIFETPTLNLIKEFSEKNPDNYILYLHTKGIRYWPENNSVNDWINYMLYFLVEQNSMCTSILDKNYDVVGCNYINDQDKNNFKYANSYSYPYYNGNFWWGNTNYLRTLPTLSLDVINKNDLKFWLFKNNPNYYNLHSSNMNHYHGPYPKELYIKNNNVKNTSINTYEDNYNYIVNKNNLLINTKSEINEHLCIFSDYAEECNSILEVGIRNNESTWAFIYGLIKNKNLCKKNLSLIDYKYHNINEILINTSNISDLKINYFTDSKIPTENADLTFINTLHCYGQLKKDLIQFSEFTNKYIIIHGTALYENDSEIVKCNMDINTLINYKDLSEHDLSNGTKNAINEFLHKNKDWVLYNVCIHNNGLTILRRINNYNEKLLPITFSLPEEKLAGDFDINIKEKIESFVKPLTDRSQPYLYDNEKDYYNDYQTSFFAFTCKRNGWDSLRNYEILANNCIPFFIDIDQCPEKILFNFPKEIIKKSNILYEKVKNLSVNEFKNNSEFINEYTDLLKQLKDYTANNLTTRSMVNYILKSTNNNPTNILFLSPPKCMGYLESTLLHGFKKVFGKNCHDYPKNSIIYKNSNDENIYGNGFTYSKLIEDTDRDNSLDETIIDDIKNKKYDMIIYSQVSWESQFYFKDMFYDIISDVYEPSKVIFINGHDHISNFHLKHFYDKIIKGHFCYIREFNDQFNNYDYLTQFIKYFMR